MLLILIFSLLIKISRATNYCSICPQGTHTMCLYHAGPGPECVEYKKVVLTKPIQQYIVDIHNDIRNHVASGLETTGKLGRLPSAANMMMLEWDEELARIAQRWADQCITISAPQQHDLCKATDRFEQIGQNILTAVTNSTALPELAILILNWFKQVSNVIPSDVDYFSGIKRGQYLIGQYTQLVWAKTRYVGCGMSIYKENGNKYFDQRLVCNYAPGGNIIGTPIYEVGAPCSQCPTQKCDNFREALCENQGSISLTTSPTKIRNRKINDWKGNEFKFCVRIPEYSPQDNSHECLNFSSTDDAVDDNNNNNNNKSDLMIFKNISIEEYFIINQTRQAISCVLDLTKNGLSLMNNQSYLKLMQSLKISKPQDFDVTPSKSKKNVRHRLGKWFNGRCHCDYIYREGNQSEGDLGSHHAPLSYVLLVSLIVVFCM